MESNQCTRHSCTRENEAFTQCWNVQCFFFLFWYIFLSDVHEQWTFVNEMLASPNEHCCNANDREIMKHGKWICPWMLDICWLEIATVLCYAVLCCAVLRVCVCVRQNDRGLMSNEKKIGYKKIFKKCKHKLNDNDTSTVTWWLLQPVE